MNPPDGTTYTYVIYTAGNPLTGRTVTMLPPFEFTTYAQRATFLQAFIGWCQRMQDEDRDPMAVNPYALWGGLEGLE